MANILFHEGELTLQDRAGSRERLAEMAPRLIRSAMTEQHQAFFSRLPYVVLGGMDGEGQVWATLLAGSPGFIQATSPELLSVRGSLTAGDPLAGHLTSGSRIGLLGIDALSRRRNRLNGRIVHDDGAGFDVAVDQSFGNCPKYIHSRSVEFLPGVASAIPISRCAGLDDTARLMIRHADTFFIASAYPGKGGDLDRHQGVDVSHRGGCEGFVDTSDNDTLIIPDYSGNSYFNTLGNLLLNPQAGLLFIDFNAGRLLWLAAEAEIILDSPHLERFPQTERLLRLRIIESRYTPGPLPLRWTVPPPPAAGQPPAPPIRSGPQSSATRT